MKLDMDLVRELLLKVESLEPYRGKLSTKGNNNMVEAEHLELLIEANFCKGQFLHFLGETAQVEIYRLTWEGHQFLNTIRDDETWSKTKSTLNKFGSFTIDLIQKVAVDIISKNIFN